MVSPSRGVAPMLLVAVLLCLAGPLLHAGEQPVADDGSRAKAVSLYKLAKFVDWPADVLPPSVTAFTVCVVGTDPFGAALEEAFRGRQVNGRAVIVHRGADVDGASCQMLFLSSVERKRTPAILERLGARPVLTVGDDEGFCAAGGMIELATDGERIRFVINTAAAERAHLHLNARLLALASPRPSGATR